MAVRVILFLTLFTGLCVADPTGNLALEATAVQSSTYERFGPQYAVDGNKGLCSHTKDDKDPWWRVDLLHVYKVTRVVITNRGDVYAERINGTQIRIGNSLENNGNNNELAATVESIPPGVTKTFEFQAIRGRYVNIVIPGRSEYLTLCEVEVFGEKYTSSYTSVPGNLALQVTAVQSSTYKQAGAQKAIDGNMNSITAGGSCSHTNNDMNPWWRVDLLEEQAVTRVSITNRGDGYAERINGAQIRIGNSLDNDGNNNELAATVESIPAGATKPFEFQAIRGRYVNIVIPGRSEYLTLCEVEVFAEKDRPPYTCFPRNLALGAPAVHSSTYEDSWFVAQKAVDGNRDFCSHTKNDMNPWWRVDLQEVYKVTRVVITNRINGYAERLNGAQIHIGNSLDNDGNSNELAAAVESIPLGETKTFEFKPIKGRYVNIVLPGRKEYLTLCEVEVYAD